MVALMGHGYGLGVLAGKRGRPVAVHVGIMATHARHESAIGRVVEILGLLAHPIHAVIRKVALNTSQTRSFVACKVSTHRCQVQSDTHHKSDVRADTQSKLSWPSSSSASVGLLHYSSFDH
jgi:hypothetical protein